MLTNEANPMGLCGFEFIEFCAHEAGILEDAFTKMGFTLTAHHRSKPVHLWRQGGINLIANYTKDGHAGYFAREHGPSVCGMAFRVGAADQAYTQAIERGAEAVELSPGPMELRIPAIRGIGGSLLYLIDLFGDDGDIYDVDFTYIDGADHNPFGAGLTLIDHLTHNLYDGRIRHWEQFYTQIFGFHEFRQFDVTGEYSGLNTKVMVAPDGKIRIPLNEEGGTGGKGQIAEYLRSYNGEGIQHIAFASDNLYATLDELTARGLAFAAPPPDAYYSQLEARLPGHGESIEELKKRAILVDGSTEEKSPRLLMQIFSRPMLGPVFFEFIQRKGDEGFGEGNIEALFRSVEKDELHGALRADGQ